MRVIYLIRKINYIETTEQTRPFTVRKVYNSLEQFSTKFSGTYDLYRCKNIADPTGINLSHTEATLYVKDKLQLEVNVTPGGGTMKWKSSNTNIATVSQAGVVTAKKVGTVTITCTVTSDSQDYEPATCQITVKKKAVNLNHKKLTLYKDQFEILIARPEPQATVVWKTSNKAVAEVIDGFVIAKKKGTASISATANGVTEKCVVTVKNPSVKFDVTTKTLYKGESFTLKPTVLPDSKLTWKSSKPDIASVENGKVISKKVGKTVITATAENGASATCTVNVKKPKIVLSATKYTLCVGDKKTLTATAYPSQPITWESSDTSVVTVTQKGEITTKKLGKATITAKTAEASATCVVTVKKPTVTLNKTTLSIYIGESSTLTATVNPSASVTWKSSNSAIATVNKGVVYAKAAGTVNITATAKGVTAKCTVTVNKPTVSISKSAIELYTNQTYTLTATPRPSATVTWKSSNTNVATVSGGVVTAKKAGTTTITATAHGITCSCRVTVKNPTLTISKTTATTYMSKSITLTAKATPATTIVWKSGNTKIATVSGGVVTGKTPGQVTISATANGITKYCIVTVKANANVRTITEIEEMTEIAE